MRIDVTLRGSKAEQWNRIQEELEERRGHELKRSEVAGIVMADFEQSLEEPADRSRSRR
ncbi:hypothetical protein NP511_22840 (plasmid) [Natrinema thermotolerans]|uniref:Uncharacterized protein n=1 Tax=Natrinema thermotolerans TaxID=121872 RepID=A0AAF0PFT8_9EURY|nr:hypothetical protein [Natrinema thermotolerans]WMT10371.1 hypothetical protein NP511_22840 [Natrinema thermotolerans]WPH65816.1 hypothetical protein HJIV1_gp25 [Haloterrigena jeotgali icosahedral virus 1]